MGGVSGFKGFGLAFAIDIISGALSQAGCSGKKNSQHGNATTFICLKTSAFSKLSDFRKNVKILTDHVKSSRTKKDRKLPLTKRPNLIQIPFKGHGMKKDGLVIVYSPY